MKIAQELIVVEVDLPVPPSRVWTALTDPSEMPRWFFTEIRDFRPEVGFEGSFVVTNEGRDFDHRWLVREVEALTKLSYGWRYEGYRGNSLVTFELDATAEGTRLRLRHEVTEDFAEGVPEFTREACVGGWHYFLQERLPAFLANPAGV